MKTNEIVSDVAAVALECNGSVFTIPNEIGCDGAFSATVCNASEFQPDGWGFVQRMIVGNMMHVCWSDCFNPTDPFHANNKNKFVAKLESGVWSVFVSGGDFCFVRESA